MSKHKRRTKENAQPESTDSSTHVFQRDKIKFPLHIKERTDFREKQKRFIDLVLDKKTKVIFVTGPAGTGKTYLAIYCALQLLNMGKVSDLVFVRSIVESASKSLGSLPGEADEKMKPFLMPLFEKLEELLPRENIDQLTKEKRIIGIPINFLRGASINAKCVIAEEAQNFDYKELKTFLTRIGEFSKFIVIGDPDQSDIGARSGFLPVFDLFNDDSSKEKGIHCFSFTKEDIVRSGILGYIIERYETMPRPTASLRVT